MAFGLIPLPISIIFILVFIASFLVVLWKLRKSGKVYRVLFSLAVVLLALALAAVVYVFTAPPIPTGNGPVEVEVVSSKTVNMLGPDVIFQIVITNPHSWAVPYPTSISFSLPPVGDEGSLTQSDQKLLLAHSKTTIQSLPLWIPTHPGNYTLTVILHGTVDYGQSTNYTYEVKPAS